ncbi:MAG: helicase C-terminal domain-containing protein [Ktedonobacteraceae bacterium]
MAKKPPVRVALDLETTGLHVEQDTILEVAAIKFQGNDVIDTFESFVAPGRSIPFRVQRLTNITTSLLTSAPLFEAISPTLQSFLGDLPIVGHSIPFDAGFLRKRGLARTNPLIDTFELASVLLPSLKSYNLGQVAEALGISVPVGRHRAMVDTVLAKDVFLALHERLQTIDLTLLRDLANLDAPRSWPLLSFFRQELRSRQEQEGVQATRGSLGDHFASQLGMDPRILSFAIARSNDENMTQSVSPSVPGGVVEQALNIEQMQTQVEVIPEQEEVATQAEPTGYQTARAAVREAFEQHTPLMIEVTVGGNDYTPALLPALEWLPGPANESEQPRRIVIACGNQQSARRLLEIVLPRLQARLAQSLPVAYWAERGGYLCPHRWFGVALRRTSGELTAEQARGIAKVGLWAQQTLTGERGELTLLQQENTAWERISSGVEHIASGDKRSGTMYERCTYRKKGYCFVSRAEERVQAAQIVVTTHTGLFDDLSRSHSLLAPIDYRLILDADMLEEENVRWSSADLDQSRLLALLNTIGTELPDNRYQGLLALAAPSLRERGPGGLSVTPTIPKAELDARMLTWFQALRQARTAVEKLFACYHRLLEESIQQGSNGNGRDKGKGDTSGRTQGSHNSRGNERTDTPLRLTGQIRALGAWVDTERAWQQAANRLQAIIDITHEAEKTILTTQRSRRHLDVGSGEDSSVAAELVAAAQQLLDQKKLGQQAMSLNDSDIVYWLRMPPTSPSFVANKQGDEGEGTPVLYSQLVQTSALLRRLLLRERSSTIFVGASLSVDNSFSYYRGRFGLENETSPAFSVVTEHHEQTLLYLPNDVPEPNQPQYQRHLEEALIQLVTALKGQTVVLFTSHAALRSSYSSIKQVLESRGILVLGQGMDGSARQLWQVFQSQEHVVLLGTNSFWDGLEDMQHSPTCIVVTRLPMPVLHDPPIAARAEHYSDQLHQLTVPVAALRMRRTLNKLAWNDTKRNAIVLFDRRVTSKEYGSMVLHSLPRCSQRQSNISHMPESILEWLMGTDVWE